jgi:hypothetical protein
MAGGGELSPPPAVAFAPARSTHKPLPEVALLAVPAARRSLLRRRMRAPHPLQLRVTRSGLPALLLLTLLALCAGRVDAQAVAPPVVEHVERAASAFEVANQGLTPVTVVMEPYAFWVDTLGEVHYAPFDTASINLRLATMSIRLPPRATYSVAYEANSKKGLPAWFVIASNFAGPRMQGMNVRLQLPHVVYLNQKEALPREDVVVRGFVYDSVQKKVRFKIENTGARLGRCNDGSIRSAGGENVIVPSFPMFPHFFRWVELPWTGSRPPERLELKFEKFTLQATRREFAAAG